MIFLVGFMGSGKTTVGRQLAKQLAYRFVDLDISIEAAAGRAIHEIFDQQGEAAFRELEHRELTRMCGPTANAGPPAQAGACVVALGGGAFTQPRNVDLVRTSGGTSVWLNAPAQVLLDRCARHGVDRPLARDTTRFLTLYEERLPFYARAEFHVNAANPAGVVVEEILKVLRAAGRIE
jgi:shikimate kinase